MQVVSADNLPEHSDQVSLEVELLKSSRDDTARQVALVVASDADVRAYVSDSLRQLLPVHVISVGSIASALEEASRSTPRLVVVSHDERAVLRHLPVVPAVLLSDDIPAAEAMSTRLAPLVILRGAVAIQRLVDVATSLLAWESENVSHVAAAITHVANSKEAT